MMNNHNDNIPLFGEGDESIFADNANMNQSLVPRRFNSTFKLTEVPEQIYHSKPQIQNPYKVFYQTLKNPFEVEEVLTDVQQEEAANHNQLVLSEHNKLTKLPRFYYVEKNIYGLKALGWGLLFLVSFAFIIAFILVFLSKNKTINLIDSNKVVWFHTAYFSIPTLIGIGSLLAMTFQTIYYRTLNIYIKNQQNKFHPSSISGVTQNIYKRLLVSFININWGCFIFYLWAAFYILIMFIVSYFITMSYEGIHKGLYFGQMTMGPSNDPTYQFRNFPKLSCIIVGTLTLLVVMYQVISQVVNWSRINKIDLEFNVPILTMDEKVAVKKATHKRNFICFLVIFIILGLLALIIYFIMRGKRK